MSQIFTFHYQKSADRWVCKRVYFQTLYSKKDRQGMRFSKDGPKQHFTRKPSNRYQEEPEQFSRSTGNLRLSSSTLKLYHNTISIAIAGSSPSLEEFLSDSLFSLDSTPVRPLLDKKTSESRLVKLEYSPDSRFINTPQYDFQESDLLLDTAENDQRTNFKYQTKTTVSHSEGQGYQSRVSSDYPLCSHFSLDSQSLYAFKVSLITLNSYIIKISFRFKESKRQSVPDNLLLSRMTKYFKEKPLELFNYYNSVLKTYSSPKLRIFLISNSIRFSTGQIEALEDLLEQQLKEKNPDHLLEWLVFRKDEEDELILNLSQQNLVDAIDLSSQSLWQTFGSFMHRNSYFRSMFSFEVGQLLSFIKALI